jgi:hypothetical protein
VLAAALTFRLLFDPFIVSFDPRGPLALLRQGQPAPMLVALVKHCTPSVANYMCEATF